MEIPELLMSYYVYMYTLSKPIEISFQVFLQLTLIVTQQVFKEKKIFKEERLRYDEWGGGRGNEFQWLVTREK